SYSRPPSPTRGLTVAARRAGHNRACRGTTVGHAGAWGYGVDGQLRNGSSANHTTPQLVSGDLDFRYITVGGYHTCGITTAGDTYCWGLGQYGQLGNGSTVDESAPQLVSGDLEFAIVVAGWWHTCGITT